MASSLHKAPTRLRTYASDLEAERARQGKPSKATPIPAHASAPTPEPIVKKPKSLPGPAIKVESKGHSIKPESKRKIEAAPRKHIPIPRIAADESVLKPKVTAPPPKKIGTIPAFHELEKKVSKTQEHIVAEESKQPITPRRKKKDKKARPHRPNIGYDATVITEKKTNRFKLIPAIIDAIVAWAKSLKLKHKKKKAPQYVVPETHRRKGVIERATTKTGSIFTADNETLKEQIRRRRQKTDAQANAETTWSPFTETVYPLLEAPEEIRTDPQNVAVEYKKIGQTPAPVVPAPIPTSPAPAPEAVPVPEPAPTPTLEPITTDPVTGLTDEERWSQSDTEPQATEPTLTPEIVSSEPAPVAPTPQPLPATAAIAPMRGSGISRLQNDTNTLTVILLASVLGVVAVIFAGYLLVKQFSGPATTNTPVVTVTTNPIFANTTVTSVPIGANHMNVLPVIIKQAVSSSSAGIVEFTIVSGVGDELSAPYLFDLLSFKTVPIFKQSLTIMRFVSVNHGTPAIAVQFVDTDTVRGGFLNWEATMARDLRALYDIPADMTLDFIDDTIAGKDVRVLRVDGRSWLVYGIIGDNTALIAPNTATFSQVVELGLRE
ncbi:hypothetical protein KC906_01640 [Candidatus Kaiserbacteria bacterium]|nr:hypothetical protein [Candidatus Kaiserbacteria bacterium]MCB9812383.1 hypothetical protein [Candidatus Nomurabacteria bacterium]